MAKLRKTRVMVGVAFDLPSGISLKEAARLVRVTVFKPQENLSIDDNDLSLKILEHNGKDGVRAAVVKVVREY